MGQGRPGAGAWRGPDRAVIVVERGTMRGLFNRIQDLLGIYGTGFAAESVLGILLPLAFVVLVGGLGVVLVLIR